MATKEERNLKEKFEQYYSRSMSKGKILKPKSLFSIISPEQREIIEQINIEKEYFQRISKNRKIIKSNIIIIEYVLI